MHDTFSPGTKIPSPVVGIIEKKTVTAMSSAHGYLVEETVFKL